MNNVKIKVFSSLNRNMNKLKWPHPILIKEQIELNGYEKPLVEGGKIK